MSICIVIDWKFVIAFGAAVSGIIFAAKMEPDAVERVSTRVVDTYGVYMTA